MTAEDSDAGPGLRWEKAQLTPGPGLRSSVDSQQPVEARFPEAQEPHRPEEPDGLPGDCDQDEEHQPTRLQRRIRVAGEWLIVAIVAVGLAMLIRAFLVQAFEIPSGSMMPTLQAGDRVVVYKLGYRLHDVGRGDVVVFQNPGDGGFYEFDDLIKRVVAVEGDTFELIDGAVFINGRMLEEPYLAPGTRTQPRWPIPGCENAPVSDRCHLPPRTVLVLGDNRDESHDGRFFGPIGVDTVVGRAFLKYWPPNRIGTL